MSRLITLLQQLYTAGHSRPATLERETDGDLSALRPAAVLAGVIDGDVPSFLMIHRPSTMRAHPGQVAFPGGKLDPGETVVEAALREAHEELGIVPDAVTIIGPSDLYPTYSGYAVTPVLAVIAPDTPIHPNPTEVAQWFTAPLDFVLDPANHASRTTVWQGRSGNYIEMMWHEHRIWGVTGGIIANLSRRIAWNARAQ